MIIYRSADISTRKKYIELVESVRAIGGKVLIFSSLHVSGERKLLGFLRKKFRIVLNLFKGAKLSFFFNRTKSTYWSCSNIKLPFTRN